MRGPLIVGSAEYDCSRKVLKIVNKFKLTNCFRKAKCSQG